jgi:hypothetical protein
MAAKYDSGMASSRLGSGEIDYEIVAVPSRPFHVPLPLNDNRVCIEAAPA